VRLIGVGEGDRVMAAAILREKDDDPSADKPSENG
jgi:hypothetical protein